MVRLITHNLLACHAKGCTTNNFPLAFRDAQVEIQEQDINPEFVRNMLPRLEWKALVDAARQVGDESLPAEQPEMMDDELVQKLHRVLMEVRNLTLSSLLASPNGHDYPSTSLRTRDTPRTNTTSLSTPCIHVLSMHLSPLPHPRTFLQIHITEGAMICPNCEHVYPISNGIPNMLLAENEIG
ncbi:Trm112p-domain-containing protein [Coniophora puteana RWD-64-598 SS2]|uniref:Trm112p-domain-containing protein n=1 Tax=Coniophora puteana (strain RWD-64-598) TaxID=741705 RepID=A0A5M3MES4_CONPW|nr:Trm112p-domain-containing protein [Coniophora puteana RWD-64-598 SS2]EIW77653.1 Trm112p-domain-containing protein [Coniophora puteana RWD-64-598 SS2]